MEARHKIEDIHLSDYWNIVKKRRMLVVGCTVVAVAFALVSSFLMKPVFKTTARLAVERETISSPIAATRTEYADVQSQMLTFNTHFRLLTSKPVLLMLLEELEKENNAAVRGAVADPSPKTARDTVRQTISQSITGVKSSILGLFGKGSEEVSPEMLMVRKLNALQNKITVTHLRDTRLLTIDVEDTDPQIAARIANLLSEKYIEFDMGIRLDADNRHIAWLTRELYNMGQKLEDDEKKFFEYKQQQGVFSLEGQQRVLDQRSSELNNEYLVTQNQRQEIDTKLTEIEKKYKGVSDIAHIRSILDNQSINSIYNTMTALELEHARQSKVLKPKHPKMLQMASEIEKVKDKLKSELEKEVENMRVQRTVLLNREKLMKENIAQFEQDVLDASTKELTYTILQRNMDTSQKLYDTLVSKIKETGIVAGAVASNVRIVETSIVPLSPYKPDKKRNLLLGLLLGAAGGVGLAFFREYLDLTIRDEEDIARLVELPVLAVIPIAHKAEKRGY